MLRPRIFLMFMLLVSAAAIAVAQSSVSGNTPLTIRCYMAGGGLVPSGIQVELLNGSGIPIAQGMLDNSGQVNFMVVENANYSVRVTGPGVATLSYTFTIWPNEGGHIEQLQLTPAGPGSVQSRVTGKHPTVSVLDLNSPPKARKEFGSGAEALKAKNWSEARKHYEKAIEIYPQFVSAYNDLGVALIKLGEREKAREHLNHAIQLDPAYARPYVNLARMDAAENKYSEAEELLKKATKADPENAEALFLLSNAQLQNGHYDDSIASARKVYGIAHQGFEGAHLVCAMALVAENRNSEAADEYRAFLKEAPDSSMAPQARTALAAIETASKK
jgi:cytochrome c-type biogenesis protein CcmH/NrfG